MPRTRRHVFYRGNVQGVGFRYTTRRAAEGHDVAGFVRNLSDGRVELVAEGEATEVEAFLAAIDDRLGGHIRGREGREEPPAGETGFTVKPTR